MQKILQQIATELSIKPSQVEKTVELIDEGNTIPFIARYRKEVTGALTDTQLRDLNDRLTYLRNLESRREEVERLITELGKMTPELKAALDKADKLSKIEDIYRPFKPKRRTRGMIAKEKGLEPLSMAMMLAADEEEIKAKAEEFTDEEKGVKTIDDAISGAMDIIAENFSDDAKLRDVLRKFVEQKALIETTQGKEVDEKGTYDMYFDSVELASKMPPHRVLAINRGEREKCLKVSLKLDDDAALDMGKAKGLGASLNNNYVEMAYKDAYKRLILPSLERELRTHMTEIAEEHAISVFGINLKQLLMQAPLKNKVVMGYDPAYRTGCKIAVLDKNGKLLDYKTIYPTKPQLKIEESKRTMLDFIAKYDVDLIAIGNGTASRESEQFVADVIRSAGKTVHYLITNEAGASVYSASKLAASEYPDIDVSIRGAISIGARVQDPLSELVKIDPKSIGVGQYQHDVNQKRLNEVLGGTVEDAVNSVGVDVKIASESLLSYISGITSKTAKAIVAHRQSGEKFTSRKDILKVKGIGAAAFKQAAGFLRIDNPKEPLDNTGVHPESYEVCYKLMHALGIQPQDIGKLMPTARERAKLYGMDKLAKALDIHRILLEDLISELDKPARDPRDASEKPLLRADVMTLDDLTEGMVLKGTVRNVVDFGAFVDIGVKQDGLVHISELANKFVKRAMDVVAVGDIVDVKVLGVDKQRQKISLSIKQA